MTPAQKKARADRAAAHRAQSGRAEPRTPKSNSTFSGERSPESRAIYKTPEWERVKRRVLVRDAYCCYLCSGILPEYPNVGGANSADHVLSHDDHPEIHPYDMSNLRGVHAYPKASPISPPGKPIYCNSIKHMGSAETARRKIRARLGVAPEEVQQTVTEPEGRDW